METSKIIDLVFKNNGIIFGGYIRDMIAGDIPNDLDIRFNNKKDGEAFINALVRKTSIKVNEPLYTYPKYHVFGRFYELVERRIDITFCNEKHPNEFALCPDVNVNMLYMDSNFSINFKNPGWECFVDSTKADSIDEALAEIRASESRLHVLDVLSDIRARRFFAYESCKTERLEKMVSRGWTRYTKLVKS